jgi:hypothetical protein
VSDLIGRPGRGHGMMIIRWHELSGLSSGAHGKLSSTRAAGAKKLMDGIFREMADYGNCPSSTQT